MNEAEWQSKQGGEMLMYKNNKEQAEMEGGIWKAIHT